MDSNAEILKPFVDYFRKQPVLNEHFFNLCYFSAYGALPQAVEANPEEFWKTYYLARQPGLGWYAHLCLLTQTPFSPFQASALQWHKGRLPNGREYMILEYPEPDPMVLTAREFEKNPEEDAPEEILYPYYSAILRTTTSQPSACFSLGQSPVYGVTSLRRCRPAAHYNLGIGPDPSLEGFLSVLEEAESLPVQGVAVLHQDKLDAFDRKLAQKFPQGPPDLSSK